MADPAIETTYELVGEDGQVIAAVPDYIEPAIIVAGLREILTGESVGIRRVDMLAVVNVT